MTDLSHIAAVPAGKFQVQNLNDCFNRERTMTKKVSMTELRDKDEAARAAMAHVLGVADYRERCAFRDLTNLFDDWDFLNQRTGVPHDTGEDEPATSADGRRYAHPRDER